jgi:hypothetical protein
MKTIRLEVELTYEDDIMHENDLDEIEWFYKDILGKKVCEDGSPNLILHSNEIGDEVGLINVLKIL